MEGLRLEGLADVHRPVSADAHEAGPKPDRVSGFFSPQVPSRRSSQWAANNGKVSGRENLGNIVSSAPKRRSSTAWEESQVLSSAPMNQHSDLVSSVSSPKSGVASPKRLSMQRSSTMRASKESSLSKPSEGPDSAAQIVRERRGTLESYSPRTQMELMDHPLGEFLLPILPPNEGENGHGSLPTRTSNVKHYYGVAAKRRSSYQGGAPVAPVLPVKHPPALAQFLDSAGAKPNDIQNVEADAAASKERIAEKVAERRQSYAGFGLRDPGSPKRQGGRLSVKASSNQRRASEAPGADPSSFAFRLPYQLKPRRVWTLEEAFRTVREGAEDLASEDFPTEGEARWLGAGGAAEWRPCMVLGYDRGDHKYWVQWLAPRPGDSDACARRFQVARMNLRIGNLGEGGHSWQKPREATGGVEKRLGKLGGLGEKRTGRGGALREGDGGGMAAILAELAEEYAGESRQPEAWKQEGEAENGDFSELAPPGPRPVPVPTYSYADFRAAVSSRAFLCQPSLQPMLLEMGHLLEALSRIELLDCRRRVLTPMEARAHQSKVLKDGVRYVREHLIEEMVDSLALGVGRWTLKMEQAVGDQQSAKVLRWANLRLEEALCGALQGTLLRYTELFQRPRGDPPGSPVFEVGMSMRGDGQLELQAHPGVLATFSGHLLDDLEETLRNTPAFSPSDDRYVQKGPKLPRPTLARTASSAILRTRSAVRTSIDAASELLRTATDQLAQEWASKLPGHVGAFSDNHVAGSRDDADATESALEKVESMKAYLGRLEEVEKAVLGYHGRTFGEVFILNCRQPLQWLAAERAERREALSRELFETLHDCVRLVQSQLDRNEALLRTDLDDVTPEELSELERFTGRYEATHAGLLASLREGREALDALENLRAPLSQDDVSALWAAAREVVAHAERVSDARGRLWIVKPGVIAGLRRRQAELLEAVKATVAAVAGFEGFEDLEAAGEYQAQTARSLNELSEHLEAARRLQVQETLLGIDQLPDCLELLTPAFRKVRFCADVWALASEFLAMQRAHDEAPFKQMNVGRAHLRVAELADKIDELGGSPGARELGGSPAGRVLQFLETQVRDVLRELPVLAKLRHPGVRQRHWEELGPALGARFVETGRDNPTLSAVLALRLSERRDDVSPVLERAIQEYAQEVCLEKMEEELRRAAVEVAQGPGGLELRGLGEIEALLGEQLVAINSLLSSPFAKAFEGMARTWRERLGHLRACLGELVRVQEAIQTLEPVFKSPHLQQLLPSEHRQFQSVAATWQAVLALAAQRRFFLFLCESTLVTKDVPACNVTMADFRSKLTSALDGKRARFARLYFLTDDELVTFASLELNPTVDPGQTLICKCFQSLSSVDFNRDREIVAVSGLDGERVALTQGVGTKDEPLEKWLAALDAEIRNTLKMGLAKAVDYLESGRGGSLLQFCRLEKNDVADAGSESSRGSEPGGFEEVGPSSLPCQSVGLALQVSFTRRVEKILSREESADLKRRNLHSELERLQEQVEDLRTAVGKGLAGLARVKAKLLIRLGARLSRTLQKLIECSGKDLHTERFAWQKHLRFYYDPAAPRGASCRMEMAGAKLNYGFEFLGQQERAIVTSEMERCFAGLLGAVASGGCALVTGTPGAGRAELVRALAAAAGKTCLFEVCSGGMSLDRLNGQMRASIASGTWFCLRDVGAVGADVAQSLVQQLASVKQALTSSGGRVQLAGSTVQVDRTAAVFCTAQIDGPQPSDRLTATCRATALGNGAMVADVAGALLHAEGFENWEGLGRKLATALRFASQQLGARPFAAGLPAAHALVERAVRARAEMTSAGFGNVSEEALLAGVVERAIAPGLLGDELTSFQRLLTNVFPGGSRPGDTNGRLKEAVREAVRERGLSEVSGTVQKCVQLQECMALDCLGTVVCGEAGAGKSELIAVLARAKEKLTGSKVAIESVAVAGTSAEKLATTCDEILARQDCDTWVVFDGAIGADQADAITGRFGQDSRLFALAGGKGHRLKVIFEVDSPENIPSVLQGRCALVHVGRGEAVDWNALVKAWVERSLPPSWAKEAALFKHLCEKALPACLELVMSGAPANLDLVPTGLVQSFLCLVGITLASFYSASGTQRPKSGREEGPEADQGKGRRRLISYGRKQARDMVSWRRLHLHKEGEGKLHNRETVDAALKSKLDDVKPSERAHLLTTAAVFATVNSLGLAIAGATDRAALEHVIRDVIRDLGLKEAPPLPEESLFEVGYSWQFRSWRRWPELRTESAAADGKASGVPSGDVRFFVPVPETARNEVLAKTVLRGGGRVAVYGPPGSGKKSLIGHVVRNAAKEEDGRKSGGMETAGWGQFLEKSESSACGCSGITIDSEGSERPNARLLRKYNLLPTVPYSCDSLVAIFAEQLGAAWPERAAGMGGTNEPGRSTPGLPDSLVLRLSKASIHFHQTLLQTLPNPSEELGLGTRDLLNLLGALVTNSDALKATSDALTSDSDAPTAGKDAGLPATDADAVKLWAHEVRRVYGDRLSAAAAVESALAAAAALYLREWASLAAQPVMFGQYTRHSDANGDVRVRAVYKEVTDKPGWVLGMEGQLAAHNMENSDPLPIVLFPEAAEHLSRLLRALRGPGSQALLIGPPRSGKRSLLRLAAFVLGFDRFEIGEKNGNEPGEWREEVGKAVERAALGDRGVVLGVKAGQPGLMKDVAQLRNGHEVLSLLSPERRYFIQQEQQRLEESSSTSLVSLIDSAQEREAYFNARLVERVNANLRIAVCATARSPALAHILTDCRPFADACSVDRFDAFSDAALAAIARAHFDKHEELQRFVEFAAVERGALAAAAAAIHARARGPGVASYQELLRAFSALLLDRGGAFWATLQRLTVGAAKLRSTARLVAEMQSDLEALLGRRDSTEEEMERLIGSIAREQDALDASRAALQVEQEKAERESAAAALAAADAQQDVDSVVPLVSQAIKELSSLNKKDIAEMKSLAKPPPRLMIVLEALCILLGRAPKKARVSQPGRGAPEAGEGYWPVARELLAQVNFVQMLLSFDKDEMDADTVRRLQPYIENPDFAPDHVGRISVACKSICIWVRAMYSYHVAKVTKMAPRVERLREVTSDLENARAALERRKVELSEMEEKISHMRSRYENARGAKNSLVQQAEESEIKVKRAERLIGRLEGECARWEKCAGELREKWRGVVGDALLAAGHVAYLGRIPRKLRESQIAEWQEALRNIRLTFSKEFSLLGFCVDQQTVQEWVAAGLPNDRQSLENAVMVKYAQRWVKIADPQNQAAAWLGRRENGRSPAWLAAESADLASSLEEALQKGRGVVVSIEKAGPSELLQSMVRSNGASQEEGERGSRVVHVKNEETAAECLKEDDMDTNCVDFSITNDGVYSQLLALVVEKERPDLEEQRRGLVQSHAALERQLAAAEERLLRLVSGASGTILDDAALEDALTAASGTYENIQGRISRVAANEAELEATRDRYRPVAERGTLLFATIRDLAKCGPLYGRRLGWFKQLYARGMQRTSALSPVEVSERLRYLTRQMTSVVFCTVAGTLFAEHRALFGLVLTARILEARGDLSPEEWSVFVAGPGQSTLVDQPPSFLADKQEKWSALLDLESRLDCFSGLSTDVRRNALLWEGFFGREGAADAQLPDPWASDLSLFQKLVLTRFLWPDQVVYAAERCAYAILEIDAAAAAARPTLTAAAEQADRLTPILCACAPGADPLVEISEFARKKSMSKRMWAVSLAEAGQCERALEGIADAAKWGKWVVLQDCHAAGPWLATLQGALEGLKGDPNVHDNFRLWLTTAAAADFPPDLLHKSVKLVFEPPQGVRAHLLRLLQQLETETASAAASRVQAAALAWYRLCFFHAIVVERCRRGRLGWHSPCSFTSHDFHTAKALLARLLAPRPATPAEPPAPKPQTPALDSRRPTPRQPGESLLPTTAEWVLGTGGSKGSKGLGEADSAAAARALSETPDGLLELLGETVYGGRMADASDRRALRTLLADCFAPGGLVVNGTQFVPSEPAPLAAYLEHARALPSDDPADLLGVRASTGRVIAAAAAETLLERAAVLWGGTADGSERTEDLQQALDSESARAAIQGALPATIPDPKPGSRSLRQDPVVAAIAREVRLFNRELEAWREESGKARPLQEDTVKTLRLRRDALAAAVRAGGGKSMRLWLPAFRSPQALFAAVAHRSAQQTGLPLDEIALTFDVESVPRDDQPPGENETQFCFEGLTLEGAELADGVLQPPGEGDHPAPILVRVVALPRTDYGLEVEGTYLCPLHCISETVERKVLGWTRLRSGQRPEGWWEKRQVAVVCRTAWC